MKQHYPNRMIESQQLTNKSIKVNSLAEAKNQALVQASHRSGIPIGELVINESFSDKNIYISVRHIKSTQNFHFEYECTNSY